MNKKSFFFLHKGISTPYDQHQQQSTSSNPWNMPSSTSNYSGTTSPPNNGATIGGNILYPTIIGSNTNSNSNNPSPLPSGALRKTPESFLGENFSNLVNLDKLVTDKKSNFYLNQSFLLIQFLFFSF